MSASQSEPSRPWPMAEEIVIVEAEDRALQQRREGQIVLRQQQAVAERHQVHHRKLRGQSHAVGACDGNAKALQRAHHRRGEGCALAHQDENVGGADRPALRGERLAAVEPMPDLPRDPVGQHHGGRRRARAFAERLPGWGGIALLGLDHRPDLDETGLALAMGEMTDGLRFGGEAAGALAIGEDQVYRFENHAGAAEGEGKRRFDPGLLRRAGPGRIAPTRLGELARIGALKAVDRLLLVADGEQRPLAVLDAFAGEELGRERLDQRPLRGARILRLIDKDVIDSGVEPEQYPGGGVRALEQRRGARDQPVEIDGGALGFFLLITLDDRIGETEEGGGRQDDLQRAAPDLQRGEIVARAAELVGKARIGLA